MTTTTKRKGPPLPDLLRVLRQGAETSGQPRSMALSGGARVAYKLTETKVIFAVSRPEKRVGDTELIVFKQAAGVPETAERVPADGQNMVKVDGDERTWFQVGWKWSRA